MISAILNHLWQSSAFVVLVALVTLALRRQRAAVRYRLWFAASLKFLVPFSLLVSLGSQLPRPEAEHTAANRLVIAAAETGQQLVMPAATILPPTSDLLVVDAACCIWALGFLFVTICWMERWRRIRALVRQGTPLPLDLPIPAISCAAFAEPAVFGLFRPVLLLPAGIGDRLSPEQFRSILAHELCHVRRRDNLAASIHMFISALFWFHPLIWWMGARLVEERERACDEEVLSDGVSPDAYAEGILNACRVYIDSPLTMVSGVSGGSLANRIRRIMTRDCGTPLPSQGILLIAIAALLAIAVPFGVGLLHAQTATPGFEVATVKRSQPVNGTITVGVDTEPGKLTANNDTLKELIQAAYNVKPYQISGPAWIGEERYSIVAKSANAAGERELYQMLQGLLADRFKLVLHRETKELPAYALVVARSGPKLVESKTEGDTKVSMGGRRISLQHATIGQLAPILALRLDRPVVDRTAIAGAFDIGLAWSPGQSANSTEPSIFTAIQEQLGLRLETAKAPIEVLVIDRAEKVPTEN